MELGAQEPPTVLVVEGWKTNEGVWVDVCIAPTPVIRAVEVGRPGTTLEDRLTVVWDLLGPDPSPCPGAPPGAPPGGWVVVAEAGMV